MTSASPSSTPTPRLDGRPPHQIRPLTFQRHWIGSVPGCVWNREPGPLLNEAKAGLKVASAFGHAHTLPPRVEKCGEAEVQTAYFSAKRIVVDVPSGNEAGITAAPCQ